MKMWFTFEVRRLARESAVRSKREVDYVASLLLIERCAGRIDVNTISKYNRKKNPFGIERINFFAPIGKKITGENRKRLVVSKIGFKAEFKLYLVFAKSADRFATPLKKRTLKMNEKKL